MDNSTARKLYWEPARTCDGTKVPYIFPFEVEFVTKVVYCAEKMRRELGLGKP